MAGTRCLRAGRDVGAVGVEAAVAAHAAGDERLGDGVVGQQLGLGEGRPGRSSWRPPRARSTQLYTRRYTPASDDGHAGRDPAERLLRREERQASILHGAAAAFARTGFAATSMEDVADGVRRHQADRLPALRLQGGALPGDPPAGVRPAGRGVPRRRSSTPARRASAPARCSPWPARTPTAFTPAVAPRRPRAAVRRLRPRAAVDVGRGRARAHGDRQRRPAFDAWTAEVVIGWLVEAVLTWLEVGDPARDDDVVALDHRGAAPHAVPGGSTRRSRSRRSGRSGAVDDQVDGDHVGACRPIVSR